MGNSIYCSLIYFWVPSSCFCIVISLSLRWNNPVQRCLPVGRLHYPRPEASGGFTHWLTDCFDVQPTTTSDIITPGIVQLACVANSFVYFASSATTSRHLHVSNCRDSPASVPLAFVALFVGNGVIAVMINSPWQADDDADNQSGNNRGSDSAHTSISLTVPPAVWILQSGCQPYARTDHLTAPGEVKPRYCCGRLLTDITTINHR